jgi:hypothetical protein
MTEKDPLRELERHAENMTLFGRDVAIFIDGKPLDAIPTSFFVPRKMDDDQITDCEVVTYTTQLVLDEPIEPLNETEQKLCDWWAKRIEDELLNGLLGRPSEYQQSLRAAGAKV